MTQGCIIRVDITDNEKPSMEALWQIQVVDFRYRRRHGNDYFADPTGSLYQYRPPIHVS